jgi:Transglutaminase-like superfamily
MNGTLWRRLGHGLAICRLLPLYVSFGLLKHVVPLRAIARLAWRHPMCARDVARERRSVARVLRMRALVPFWDGDCVQKSLLLYRELSRAGANPVLAVGFRRTAGRLEGHAWVVVDGIVIADRLAEAGAFTASFWLGREGEITHLS